MAARGGQPLIVPPDQVMVPVTVTVPVPASVPPLNVAFTVLSFAPLKLTVLDPVIDVLPVTA